MSAAYALGAHPRAERPDSPHLPVLDGLRGLAIALVLLFHFNQLQTPPPPSVAPLYTLLRSGWCGVDLFFVISGFLITGILLDAKGSPHALRAFYARRFLRIFPLYYGVLVLTFSAIALASWSHRLAPGPDAAKLAQAIHEQGWWWTFAVNILYTLKGQWIFEPLSHFWSLAIEEQFYLCWPILVLLLSRRQLATACIAAIVAALAVRLSIGAAFLQHAHDKQAAEISRYVFTLCRIDTLAAGALLAIAARTAPGLAPLARPARFTALASATALLLLALHGRGFITPADRWVSTIGFSFLATFFASLLVLCLTRPRHSVLHRLFAAGALRFLGKYSYALYVFHLLLRRAHDRLYGSETLARILHSPLAGHAAHILLATATTLALAWLSWHLYEKHFLALKRFFPYTAAPQPARPAPTLTPALP